MQAGEKPQTLFWAILFCLLWLVKTSDDDLVDFDFADLKEIEWNYNSERVRDQLHNAVDDNFIQTFVTMSDLDEENRIHPFNLREHVLRSALSKALTNEQLRQKFVEVMPILRALTPQQRLTLSALISAQINLKGDQGLKLEQVRAMFGNDKKLLLPIVYDIANLVRNSARKYLSLDLDLPSQNNQPPDIERRMGDVSSTELLDEEHIKKMDDLSIVSEQNKNGVSLEEFFSETGEEMLDPKSINEELQEVLNTTSPPIEQFSTFNSIENSPKRTKRTATTSEFAHKLIRSDLSSIDDDDIGRRITGNIIQLNTTAFINAKDISNDSLSSKNRSNSIEYLDIGNRTFTEKQLQHSKSHQEVENLAFASLKEIEVNLQNNNESMVNELDEILPIPEELIAGPRYRISGNKKHLSRSKPTTTKRKRGQVSPIRSNTEGQHNGGGSNNGVLPPQKCERFTSSMCIRTEDYPLDLIMGSIRRHKNAMVALWVDFHDKHAQLDATDDIDDISIRRKENEASGGGLCQSIVRYARPQKARSASGEWKYIVNTGQHTQTLRLEKCIASQEGCSYLAHSYRSHCTQVYNYHRLLSWDRTRGLHVDIFKVPTCCSCEIDGLRHHFPFKADTKTRQFTPAFNSDIYSTINEELDYNDEQDEDDLNYQLNNGLKGNHKKYDNNELMLDSRSKLQSPNPTLGSYLIPPGGEEEYDFIDYKQDLQHKHQNFGHILSTSANTKNIIRNSQRRRPHKRLGPANTFNQERVDLDIAPSELHQKQEVNFSASSLANFNKRTPQKRQRIHSVLHTAPTSISPIYTAVAGTSTPTDIVNSPIAGEDPTSSTTTIRHRVVESSNSIATNTHQTSGPNSFYNGTQQKQRNYSSNSKVNRHYQFLGNAEQNSIPKFRSEARPIITSTTRTRKRSKPSTAGHPNQWSFSQHEQPTSTQPPHVPSFHVNSIHNTESNSTDFSNSADTSQVSSEPGVKRINYSYHPIIDFFENQKYSTVASTVKSIGEGSEGQIYPHKIMKPRTPLVSENLGANSRNGGSGLSLRDRFGSTADLVNRLHMDDNTWHPVLIKMKGHSY
ncbi:neurotrophin 1 isoform X1 [Bactrocera neohumeralis]|uniref:neurotrophin 1 isoform X1 n=1 Tax=Bactrocera neohumeralis TaxID=98809 RepID=UPI00216657AA|nr:neurotrophin 1 isoform X1 [Bactrocera neohumeralis]XP_050334480.1 neurotrophin 1 isoform X1 [Bactrocera neohumeralis]